MLLQVEIPPIQRLGHGGEILRTPTIPVVLPQHEVTLTATKSLAHCLIRVALRAPEVFQGLSEVEKNQRTRL